jgi:hypothetical protein
MPFKCINRQLNYKWLHYVNLEIVQVPIPIRITCNKAFCSSILPWQRLIVWFYWDIYIYKLMSSVCWLQALFRPKRQTNVWCYILVYDDICLMLAVLMCMFCRSLFVLLYFFFWPLCCLFFDVQILIIPLISSNSS